jgi:acyl CoA:acetate/3-ketoacid CoA transferase alpha subunit
MVITARPERSLKVLAEGGAKYHPVDPVGFREWVRDHKDRSLTPRLMSEKEAVGRFVDDGDYLVYECNYLMRGPASLIREVMRQRKRDIWLAGKFTYPDVALLVGAGCVSKVDCGFFLPSRPVQRGLSDGSLEIFEYSNVVMTLRLQAGAMGIPFLPVRSFGGTSGFEFSGAKLIEDPYTRLPVTLIPALNPDVAIIHVHQADVYGNARVFGTGTAHVDAALASRKVILSAEEIVDSDEIRRDPGRTCIPYYAVDAVVEAPFGSYPGTCPGVYASDREGVMAAMQATATDNVQAYIDKWIDPFEDDREMLEKLVGARKLLDMRRREEIREGYRP